MVVGIRNNALSERLQGEAGLTLDKAKTMVRQKEAIAEQNLQLRGDGSKQSPIVLEQVKGTKPQQRRRDSTLRSDKPQSVKNNPRGPPRENPSVHVAVDQSTKRETGVQQGMPYVTSVTKKVISAASVSLRQLQPQPMNCAGIPPLLEQ